jgi:hypothetical protein
VFAVSGILVPGSRRPFPKQNDNDKKDAGGEQGQHFLDVRQKDLNPQRACDDICEKQKEKPTGYNDEIPISDAHRGLL